MGFRCAEGVIGNENYSPEITSMAVATAMGHTEYIYNVDATDPDVGDILTYSLITSPSNMIIGPSTGEITWTPTNQDIGEHNVIVEVSDNNGGVDTQGFTIITGSSVILTQLTTNPGTDWMPHWSPDGTRIVYISSPQVVDHQSNETQDIYTVSVDGGTPIRLTDNTGVYGYGVEYSPDGNKILYSTTMQSQNLGIWYMPSTGGTPAKIYDSASNDYHASWSPDGTQIVFYSEQTDPQALWTVSIDGQWLRRLTHDYADYVPDWGPSYNIVVHSTYRTGNQDLWRISALDGEATQLTDTPYKEYQASYSPDGEWIAFGSDRSGSHGLWVMPASGGEPILIIDNIGHGARPSWSPDGRKIVFERSLSGGTYDKDIWIVEDLPILGYQ